MLLLNSNHLLSNYGEWLYDIFVYTNQLTKLEIWNPLKMRKNSITKLCTHVCPSFILRQLEVAIPYTEAINQIIFIQALYKVLMP